MVDEYLTRYDWLPIGEPNDYIQLDQLLDDEYSPAGIGEQLRHQISHAVKFVLVEHG